MAMPTLIESEAIVIGGGIAGASIAYFMAPHARVTVLEREEQVGFHSTGRSAALFIGSYGSAQVRAMTRASRSFLDTPPPGFCGHSILSPRGALTVGGATQAEAVHRLYEAIRAHSPDVRLVNAAALRARVPVLRESHAHVGVDEPDAADIDVNELHQGFFRGLRAHKGTVRCGVAIRAIERCGQSWQVATLDAVFRAPLLINAAGAWVDEVARLAGVLPIGIEPRRRSAFVFAPPSDLVFSHWPMVMDVDEGFYFKPDAGMLLGSCANADPVEAHDVQPEEFDIALGIHNVEAATTLQIRRPTRIWAGLRSFVPNGDLVGGFAPDTQGFFWVAGQGGHGIQTAAAMGEACAHLALARPMPTHLRDAGVNAAMLAPRGH